MIPEEHRFARCPKCRALLCLRDDRYPAAKCACGFFGAPNFITEAEVDALIGNKPEEHGRTEKWPPDNLGKGPNPYPYGTWQHFEHESASRSRTERFLMPFKIAGLVGFAVMAIVYGLWGFGYL